MKDINLHFLLSSARSRRWVWTENARNALWLGDWEVSNRGAGGHMKVQGIFRDNHDLLKSLNNYPSCCHQPLKFSASPQTAVERITVPCPYLTVEIRDWSQSWHFYYCLKPTLKQALFCWLTLRLLMHNAIQPSLATLHNSSSLGVQCLDAENWCFG